VPLPTPKALLRHCVKSTLAAHGNIQAKVHLASKSAPYDGCRRESLPKPCPPGSMQSHVLDLAPRSAHAASLAETHDQNQMAQAHQSAQYPNRAQFVDAERRRPAE